MSRRLILTVPRLSESLTGSCIFLTILGLLVSPSFAQSKDDAAREMARKAQDPLASVKALFTDNTVAFGPDGDTTFNFQFQPAYSIPNGTPVNIIFRAIVPVIGIEPGILFPPVGPEPTPDRDDRWGLGDIFLQYFFSPKTSGSVKWGIGPQASLRTRTGDRQAGPGWGGGLAAVIFGGIGDWALGAIAGQHWGQDEFSLATVQIIALYNFDAVPGLSLGYNNSITFNWNAEPGEKVTIPLGATIGRTFLLENGDGLDFTIGGYPLVARPDNGPDWQLKFGVSYFFN